MNHLELLAEVGRVEQLDQGTAVCAARTGVRGERGLNEVAGPSDKEGFLGFNHRPGETLFAENLL